MSISGRRKWSSFEVMDERGVQQVVQLQRWTIAGEWRGEDTTYVVQTSADGKVTNLTEKCGDNNGAREGDERGMWDSVSPFAIGQQPLPSTSTKIFTAQKNQGAKGDNRIFRFNPDYPYEMEVTHTTREDTPLRTVSIYRRHIPNRPQAHL
eukprot:TRINITY_DN6042_c0_g2_i1.p1 TRINITY_DN6042_c0_g2~~TRINITY_DN6042_c0_g2_i1.p1  ORF type:complete len:151 (+),score=11.36 TRINITY_DN6042_c0_g2_i1:55-507(+)